MQRTRASLAVLLIVAAFMPARWVSAAELSAEDKSAVDSPIGEWMQDKQVPGLSVAIVREGELAYERGYGLADVENQIPATPETVYRLASISKMLTATAVMQLVEQGKLDLAAPIQKYVPKFPEKQAPITAELLLKHQSGIRHYRGIEVRSTVHYTRVGDSLAIFQSDPLLFNPGEKFSYTTYGYNVLGAAIEGASGQDYVSYVQQHVCQPAGMKTIQPDDPYLIIPHRAAGYRLHGLGEKGSLRNDFRVDVTNKIPGGGWCATPADLARFAIALCDGRLVKNETLERMWTPQTTTGGQQTNCGFGCFIAKDDDGQRSIFHSGGQPMVSTFLIFAPDRKAAVALMCNRSNAGLKELAGSLLDRIAQPAAVAR